MSWPVPSQSTDRPRAARAASWFARAVLAALVVLSWVAPAAAHGVLVGSDPASGAVLARAPRTATLTFNEALVPRLSHARLVDRSGRVLDGVASAAAGTRLTLGLPELPAGAYTIAWRVLTEGDGHRTEGMVAFAVGSASAARGSPAPALPATGGAATRGWARLFLLAGLAAVVALLRRVVVSRPRLPGLVVTGHDPVATTAACAGVALLLGAALLARSVPPSATPVIPVSAAPRVPSAVPATATRSAAVRDLVVAVSVTPNRAGVNGFTVTAASSRRPPPAPIDAVVLESPTGGTPLRQLEPGRYVGTGELGRTAATRLTVVVLRGGKRLEIPIAWSLG
ncbi:copper resistance CopC family protein [Streptosporangium sp. NPDC051022]|uniref:copper resistance CopC family protein n=1 Tax=Streptosporangium sp. NPDC051022 TaxID=3155752 RepID=UPI00342ECEC2